MPRLPRELVTPLLLMGLTGCGVPGFVKVDADAPGVTVKALTTSVVYGAAPAPVPVPPTLAVPAVAAFLPTPIPGPLPFWADEFLPAPLFEPAVPMAGPRPACPTAGPNDFPAEPAGLDVTGTPKPGRYAWQQKGKLKIAGLIEAPMSGFTDRLLTLPVDAGDGSFTYQVEQSTILGKQVETIRVVPHDGVFLTRLQYVGRRTLDFNPVVPVELLALPVEQGVPRFSVGVDPLTLSTLRVDGTVTKRHRVDACGTVVDAWYVDGSRQFQTADGAQNIAEHDFAVAPQLGGLVLFEDVHLNGTTNDGLAYSIDAAYTIGTLDPAPAPAAQPSPKPNPQPNPQPVPRPDDAR